jgi:hypothetical protein
MKEIEEIDKIVFDDTIIKMPVKDKQKTGKVAQPAPKKDDKPDVFLQEMAK